MPFYIFTFILAAMGATIVWPSLLNMIQLWIGTDTYMHGLFVIPLCWMIWRQMPPISELKPPALPWQITAVTLWFIALGVAKLSLFNPLQQSAFLLVIPVIVFLRGGTAAIFHYKAPIMLAFLCIPFGDSLVPLLQSFTADMAVWMLQLSGVSVWRQGWYLSIVNADFRVAEACSGINFLISTLVLSIFFAFLEIKGWKKRLVFIFLGAAVPILANGVRVYLIIMIAEWGFVEAATGFDHLVYGWIFFIFVLIILGAIGFFLREDRKIIHTHTAAEPHAPYRTVPTLWLAALLSFAMVKIWTHVDTSAPIEHTWEHGELKPSFNNADTYCYVKLDDSEIHHITYFNEHDGKKMLSIDNRLFASNVWTIAGTKIVNNDTPSQRAKVHFLQDLSGREAQLWSRFIINDRIVIHSWQAKLLLWIGSVTGTSSGGQVQLWLHITTPENKDWPALCEK